MLFPLKIAHRGAMSETPENTRSAFDRALECGVDGIEFDIQITRDGIPVIYHDAFLQKITGNFASVSDHTLAELQQLDFGGWFSKAFANEKVLTLDQALCGYGFRTRLYVEIKTAPKEQARGLYDRLPGLVVQSARNCIPEHRLDYIHILSFDAEMLFTAFSSAPDLKYVLNLEAPFLENALRPVNTDMLYGYGLEQSLLRREFVAKCHDDGKKVFTYSCDTDETIQQAISLGVDGIMTNDPGGVPWRRFLSARNR